MELPESYNGLNAHPVITFTPPVFNPMVHPETGRLDLSLEEAHREWSVIVFEFVYVYVCMHACMNCMYACMYIFLYVCNVYTGIYMNVCNVCNVCMYAYVCKYVCMYGFIYIYLFLYALTRLIGIQYSP